MAKHQTKLDKLLRFLSSLECGLTLLGALGTAVLIGTVILQRPMAREGQIEQIYAPQTARLLNALGLFDVFHAIAEQSRRACINTLTGRGEDLRPRGGRSASSR